MSSIVSCIFRILCIICFAKSILTDESNEGRCPNITGPPNFSLNTLLGRWYAIQDRNFKDVRCLELIVQSAVERNLTFYFLYRDESGAEVRLNMTDLAHPNDPAILDVYLIDNDEAHFWGTWTVFYIDYNRCYGIGKCDDTTGSESYDGKHHHKVAIIIYCRNSHPSAEDLQPVFDEIKKQGLRTYKMVRLNQENCSR